MAEDGNVVYKVTADDSGVKKSVKDVEDQFEKSGNEIEKKSSGVAAKVGKVFAAMGAAAVAGFAFAGKAAISAYADYEQLVGGVETLFKQSSDTVLEYANNAFKTAGLSANEYMSTVTSFSASLLQSLGGDTEKAAQFADQAITDMADNSNKMGTSMEMIQNAYQGFAKQNYTMLDNLKLGYGGTKEEMKRLLEDAEKLTGQKFDLSSYADVVVAIHAIQESMDITGTTAKEATETIQGSVSAMKSAWQNFLVGTADSEQNMDKLIDNLADSIITVGENLIPRIIQMVPRLAAGLANLAATIIPQVISTGKDIVTSLISGLTQNDFQIIDQAVKMGTDFIDNLASGLINGIPDFLSNALPLIESFTANLKENAGKLVDSGLNLIVSLTEGLIKALPDLIAYLPQIIINIADTINENLPKILKTGIYLIWELIKGIVMAVPELIANFPKIVEAIFSVLEAVNWLSLGSKIIKGIGSGIKALADAPLTAIKDAFNAVVNFIKTLPSQAMQWGRDFIDGFSGGIISKAQSLLDAVKNIGTGIRSFMHFSRPDKGPLHDYETWMPDFVEGMAKGVDDTAPVLENAVLGLSERTALALTGTVDYNLPNMDTVAANLSADMGGMMASQVVSILVPLSVDGREIARASAWWTGEQLSWEEM